MYKDMESFSQYLTSGECLLHRTDPLLAWASTGKAGMERKSQLVLLVGLSFQSQGMEDSRDVAFAS